MELHEISVAIGELRAEVKGNREAMNRIKDRLAHISTRLNDLPSPPACVKKHSDLDRELRDIRIENAKHATIISGVVAGLALFGKQLLMLFGMTTPR